ncbi:glyoxalase [Pilimelia anulata]|uniref:Glyoxalase n=1 Tax=Pilimelia anulata TaxID=53371 RepID=A0A8J3BF71_9ACTN|nr:VOC family protein [Pilimelia anulata]GGJ99527.1 glyoxalase [Pilimelia anulata]
MSGQVVHFEIPADNVERARGFYADVFGWVVNPMPEMNYTIVQTTQTGENGLPTKPGAINGGIFERKDPLHHPVLTVDVADVTDSLERVERAGGKTVLAKQAVGDMGFVGYFTDPEGNVIGLWQNAS